MDDLDDDLPPSKSRLKHLSSTTSSAPRPSSSRNVTDLLSKLRIEQHRHEVNLGTGSSRAKGKARDVRSQAEVLMGSLDLPTLSPSAIGPSHILSLGPSHRRVPGPAAPSSWRSTTSTPSISTPPPLPTHHSPGTDLVCKLWREEVLPSHLPPHLLPPTDSSLGAPSLLQTTLAILARHLAPSSQNGWSEDECRWLHKEVRGLRREWRVRIMGLVPGGEEGGGLDAVRGVWDGDPVKLKKEVPNEEAVDDDDEDEDWDQSTSSSFSCSPASAPAQRLSILDLSSHNLPLPLRPSQPLSTHHPTLRALLLPDHPATPLRALSFAGVTGMSFLQAVRTIPDSVGEGLTSLSLAGLGGLGTASGWGDWERGLRTIHRWGNSLEILDLSYVSLAIGERSTIQLGETLRVLFEGKTVGRTVNKGRMVSTTYRTTVAVPRLRVLGLRGVFGPPETRGMGRSWGGDGDERAGGWGDQERGEGEREAERAQDRRREEVKRVVGKALRGRMEGGGGWVDVLID